MTRWKKMTAALLALCLTLGLGAVPAMALGAVEPARPGAITFSVSDAAYRADLQARPDATVDVKVYKVASIREYGLLELTEKFRDVAGADAWSPVWDSARDVAGLTDELMAYLQPEGAEEPAVAEDETVTIHPVGGRMEALQPGLYLLVPGQIVTAEWVYSFGPMLLAVPSLGTAEQAENGRTPGASPAPGESPAPAEDVDWQYEYTVFMKPDRQFRLGHLRIEKQLRTYNQALGDTTFLFLIEGRKEGEIVYSRVESLTFSGAGMQTLALDDIPMGAQVTVTEIYSGASYQPDGAGVVTVTIPEPTLQDTGDPAAAVVPFANDYTTRIIPDVAVVNRFVYNGEGWKWQSPDTGEEAEG